MKKILFIGIILISEFAYSISNQIPDLLIIGKDTVSINVYPLENYLKKDKSNYIDKIRTEKNGDLIIHHPNCFRGYQAIWKLENEKLYLIKIISYGFEKFDNSQKVLRNLFGDEYKNEKVFTEWFSSDITLVKGEIIRQIQNQTKVYEENEILKFNKGILSDRVIIDNKNSPKLIEIKVD